MALSLGDNEQVTYTLVLGSDAGGQPATEDKPPTWSEDSSGATLTLTPSTDGLSCVAAGGAPGVATITVTGDLADGTSWTDTDTVTVRSGNPVAAPTLSAGTPGPKAAKPASAQHHR